MRTSGSIAQSSNVHEAEADGYSIYVKNLPLDATLAQLEEETKRHGPIRPDDLQTSPIMIGGRQAYVHCRRKAGYKFMRQSTVCLLQNLISAVGNRGRYAPGRGGGFHKMMRQAVVTLAVGGIIVMGA
ncbi:hypothetical protein C4D60_Mb11t08890 [Musa balbisiana]|uniref:RRM domain-containing protein n=1 Tax=Musa balbisiana TaxID=52838 RepID=A0A4S8J2R1_MUSBA|nr:hypothetical protein C4D60_Mb11t08890 [Musa balbisiana]